MHTVTDKAGELDMNLGLLCLDLIQLHSCVPRPTSPIFTIYLIYIHPSQYIVLRCQQIYRYVRARLIGRLVPIQSETSIGQTNLNLNTQSIQTISLSPSYLPASVIKSRSVSTFLTINKYILTLICELNKLQNFNI